MEEAGVSTIQAKGRFRVEASDPAPVATTNLGRFRLIPQGKKEWKVYS